GSTMMGFSVIAKEAGLNFWMVLATTASVWGLPGQVAFAGLYATGASLLLIFVAVALANMRMMLMVISGADILRLRDLNLPLWRRVLMMHFLAITSWTQIGYMQDRYTADQLVTYYTGFSLTIFSFGMTGTTIGFFFDDLIPPEILRIVIFVTPIYILLLIINARQTVNRIALVIGASLCPLLYFWIGNWSVLVSGLVGGTLAILIYHRLSRGGV
ncbi:MAG: branched-chain amino acid ABC transporter permease, partial [Alphaproteobacteria bacterium]|nr:branched-chain amino acid ABC transporter permease [Alphaproteobacteria bacterium]